MKYKRTKQKDEKSRHEGARVKAGEGENVTHR